MRNNKNVEGELFKHIDYRVESDVKFERGVYEDCTFEYCDFSGVNIQDTDFRECVFRHCNLTSLIIGNTGLKSVEFYSCKMSGFNFANCNEFLFSVSFTDYILDYSNFSKCNLSSTQFNRCSLNDAEFTETNLTSVVFDSCSMKGTIIEHCNCTQADFRTALELVLDPELNILKKAKFSYESVLGLVVKYGIIVG